jgi:DNA-binding response OmpR family regulator
MSQPVVLVVEDDPAIRRGLVDALDFAGYQVREQSEGTAARSALAAEDLDLVLLDVILPGVDGFQLLEDVRRLRPTLPVIMVTARGAEADRVHGLRSGADDYVVKPFSAKELLARVEAVLRRSADRPQPVGTLVLGSCCVNLSTQEVRHEKGHPLTLSSKEIDILRYLAGNQGRPVSRDELLTRVWGLDPRGLETRTVDMHIARLREKLEERGQQPKMIVTVRSRGYMLANEVLTEGL